MIPFKVKVSSTEVMQVTATTTATTLKALIDTASGGTVDYSKAFFINHVELNPEGAIRYTLDGSTPTTSVGMQAAANSYYVFEGSTLEQIYLIATTGTVKVNVTIGQTEKQP